jgi:hypothetical protein
MSFAYTQNNALSLGDSDSSDEFNPRGFETPVIRYKKEKSSLLLSSLFDMSVVSLS